jgi:hypothetical protein
MADQNELMEQYRTTLEVMKEKLSNLREEKQKQTQDILEKKKSNIEYQKLEQNLEILQEGVQSLSLEIFKEKGNLRKLKADNEWGEEKLQSSEELSHLKNEFEEIWEKNQELKSNRNEANSDSKLAQLEKSNPKLYSLVKKIIMFEENNFAYKEHLDYLDQEKNKIRAEYYKLTQTLGQEEKIKARIREIEKDTERSEINAGYLKKRIQDLTEDLEKEKEEARKCETKALLEKYEELKKNKQEVALNIGELQEKIKFLDAEIESEKKCEKKPLPTNLKQEIKLMENEITAKAKELKEKLLERKKLQLLHEQELKNPKPIKRLKAKNISEHIGGSPKKLNSTKSNSVFPIPEKGKRDIIIGILGKSIADGNTREIKNTLRNIGSQENCVATKLVHLNRDEFLKKLNLNK